MHCIVSMIPVICLCRSQLSLQIIQAGTGLVIYMKRLHGACEVREQKQSVEAFDANVVKQIQVCYLLPHVTVNNFFSSCKFYGIRN